MDAFTDNKIELLESVIPSSQRRSAMELLEKGVEIRPLTEDYQTELRAAQEMAESKMQPGREENQKRRTKELLGTQPEVQTPKGFYEMAEQMGVKPETPRLAEKLGEQQQLPVPEKVKLPPKQPEKTRVELPRMLP
jgi:hypothetical protein